MLLLHTHKEIICINVFVYICTLAWIIYVYTHKNSDSALLIITKCFALQSVIPLWKELEYYKDYQKRLREYLGETKANDVISEALHLTSLGTNDFLENYYAFPGRRQSQFTITQYEDFLIGLAGNFIKALYGLGARKISLGGLPPMGCLPLERATNLMGGNECSERYNKVALEFNDKLKSLTIELNKELPGIRLVFSNPYYAFLHIIRRPSLYGK